jgi:hypothetical protein
MKKVYRRSLSYALVGVVASIAMFLLGLVSLYRGELSMGCIIIPMSIIFLFLLFSGLKDNEPRVVLDEEGITAREWGWVKILWVDVGDVRIVTIPRAGNSINLELIDEEKYVAQLTDTVLQRKKADKRFGLTIFSFMATSLNGSSDQIFLEIKQNLSYKSS